MEVIAGIASVSQLVAYSISCAHSLGQLHTALTSNSAYRSEESNINLLLDVIRRLPTENIPESDPVLRILIDISGLACETLHLLQPKNFGTGGTISQSKASSSQASKLSIRREISFISTLPKQSGQLSTAPSNARTHLQSSAWILD